MQPTEELVDDLFRERVLRARRMSAEQKLAAGPRLFESACQITLAGIRNQFPALDDAEAHAMLRRRLEWRRKLDNALIPRESLHGH